MRGVYLFLDVPIGVTVTCKGTNKFVGHDLTNSAYSALLSLKYYFYKYMIADIDDKHIFICKTDKEILYDDLLKAMANVEAEKSFPLEKSYYTFSLVKKEKVFNVKVPLSALEDIQPT